MSKILKVAGAAIAGFAAGILFAPKSGKETRQDIKNKAEEVKDTAVAKVDKVKKAASDSKAPLKKGAAKVEKEAKGMMKSAQASSKVMQAEAVKLSEEAKVRGGRVAAGAKSAANEVKHTVSRDLK